MLSKQDKKPKFIEIPKDWDFDELQNMTEKITKGTTPTTYGYNYVNEGINFIKIESIDDQGNFIKESFAHITEEVHEKLARSKMQEGDILVSIAGNLGRVAIVTNDILPANTNQAIAIVRFNNSNNYNLKYIFYYLKGFAIKKYIKLVSTTGAQPNLSLKQVGEFEIALPPEKEQCKIAEILTCFDNAIKKTETIIEQTEKVKRGLMQQLLTKGIGHTKFKKTEIGDIPVEWDVIELGEIADQNIKYSFTGGPFGSDLTSKEYTEEGVQIIQLQNIGEGFFNNNYRIFTSDKKADQLSSCNIFPGDIIMAKMAEPVARACIVPNHSNRYVMASDGIRLVVDKNKYSTEYVTYSINAPYFRQQAIENSTGTTRLRIGLKTLRKLKFIAPSLEEQKRISEILGTIDNKLDKERSKLEQLKKIKNAHMQQLLTGKVRVKVDEEVVISSWQQ
ncbi:restriction endonuclease subunit S [Neobacillus drentensis]|uniref:restriction endonuclease subunit S n=1 Tax=Neobacillus drentensis TaxID=220684 RepID=UPI002FFF4F5D